MSRETAKGFWTRRPEDPRGGAFLSSKDARDSLDVVYDDMAALGGAGGTVDVQEYGAVGDGVTDDIEALEAARDAAGVGGHVYFPVGEYFVSRPLWPLAGQTWQGPHLPEYAPDDDPTSTCKIVVTESTSQSLTYAEYLLALDPYPYALYVLDTAPGTYAAPLVDATSNEMDAAWYDDGSIGDSITLHGSIMGNGQGSVETENTWADLPTPMPDHSSWTLSFLAKDVDAGGLGWSSRGDALAGRKWTSPSGYPRWEASLEADTGKPMIRVYTAWQVYQEAKSDTALTANSSHVLTFRYDNATKELSVWVDKVKKAQVTLTDPLVIPTSTPMSIATSTMYVATSHWVYWTSALSDAQVMAANQVALDAGIDVVDTGDPSWWHVPRPAATLGGAGAVGPQGPEGPAGPPGPAGASSTLADSWQGEWNGNTSSQNPVPRVYAEGDIVSHDGALWVAVAVADSATETPGTSSTWEMLVPKSTLSSSWQGAWEPWAYTQGQMVQYQGSAWIALNDVQATDVPGEGFGTWELMAGDFAADLKSIVSASTDFADFKSRIAAW